MEFIVVFFCVSILMGTVNKGDWKKKYLNNLEDTHIYTYMGNLLSQLNLVDF